MTQWSSDGYPTRAALKRLRQWPITDGATALDFVASIWHWPEWGVSYELKPHEKEMLHGDEGHFLRLATGGWSGNEDLIAALDKSLVTRLTWRLSSRGGLHIYEYPHGTRPAVDAVGVS